MRRWTVKVGVNEWSFSVFLTCSLYAGVIAVYGTSMSCVRSRILISRDSIPCGEIQYVCVGTKERESRGREEVVASCGLVSQSSSSVSGVMGDLVSPLETKRCRTTPVC